MKINLKHLLVLSAILIFASCSPQLKTVIYATYPPTESVAVFNHSKDVPSKTEKIAKFSLTCNEATIPNCYTESLISTVIDSTKSIGGNAILIDKYKEANLLNSNFFIQGEMLRVHDFNSPLGYGLDNYDRGRADLKISFPYINHYLFETEGFGRQISNGFLGIALGADYYYADRKYVNLLAAGTMDFFIPFPAPFDWEGEVTFFDSAFLGLSNNHRINKFSLGYGLSLSKNTWRVNNNLDPLLSKKSITTNAGLLFTAYYYPWRNFYVGLIYRPDLIRLKAEKPFQYQHLLSIDFGWKINLVKSKFK